MQLQKTTAELEIVEMEIPTGHERLKQNLKIVLRNEAMHKYGGAKFIEAMERAVSNLKEKYAIDAVNDVYSDCVISVRFEKTDDYKEDTIFAIKEVIGELFSGAALNHEAIIRLCLPWLNIIAYRKRDGSVVDENHQLVNELNELVFA